MYVLDQFILYTRVFKINVVVNYMILFSKTTYFLV